MNEDQYLVFERRSNREEFPVKSLSEREREKKKEERRRIAHGESHFAVNARCKFAFYNYRSTEIQLLKGPM